MCWECPSVEFHTQNQSGQSQAGNYQEAGKSTPVERNRAMASKACKKLFLCSMVLHLITAMQMIGTGL